MTILTALLLALVIFYSSAVGACACLEAFIGDCKNHWIGIHKWQRLESNRSFRVLKSDIRESWFRCTHCSVLLTFKDISSTELRDPVFCYNQWPGIVPDLPEKPEDLLEHINFWQSRYGSQYLRSPKQLP